MNHNGAGNQNAARENPRTAHIGIRVTPEQLEQVKQAAAAAKMTLSAYVTHKLGV